MTINKMENKQMMKSCSTQTDEEEPLNLSTHNLSLPNPSVSTRHYNLTCFYRKCDCPCHEIQTESHRLRSRSFNQHMRSNTNVSEDYAHESGDEKTSRFSNEAQRYKITKEGSRHLSSSIKGPSPSEYGFGKDQNIKPKKDTNNDCTWINMSEPKSERNENYFDTSKSHAYGSGQKETASHSEKSHRYGFTDEDSSLSSNMDGLSLSGYGLGKDQNRKPRKDTNNNCSRTNEIVLESNYNESTADIPEGYAYGYKYSINEKCSDETNKLSDMSEFDHIVPRGDIIHSRGLHVENSSIGMRTIISKEKAVSSRVTAPEEVKKNPKKSENQYQNLQYSSKSHINDLIKSIINEKLEYPNNNSQKEESSKEKSSQKKCLNSIICKHSQAFLTHISTASKTSATLSNSHIKQTEKEKEDVDLQLNVFRQFKIKKIRKFEVLSSPVKEDANTLVIVFFLNERLTFLEILVEPLTWLENHYIDVCVGREKFALIGSKLKCHSLSRIFDDWYTALIYFNLLLDQIISRSKKYDFVMKVEIVKFNRYLAVLLDSFQKLVDHARNIKDFKTFSLKTGDYNFFFKIMHFPKYAELAIEILRKEKTMFEDFMQNQGWKYE